MTTDLMPETPWIRLRRHTQARIGLARTGTSIATSEHLSFQSAHAQARSAVHDALDVGALVQGLEARGVPAVRLRSTAYDRRSYLLRPDLGRRVSPETAVVAQATPYDISIVIADGLSAQAVQRHALPLLDAVLPDMRKYGWRLAPVAVVEQGRVAIGDEIGAAFSAKLVAVLIGERPGLTSPDSMGVYLTWAPRVGRADAERNCISNIRPEGLDYPRAARTLIYLVTQALQRQLTGIRLKDETGFPEVVTTETTSALNPRSADATA